MLTNFKKHFSKYNKWYSLGLLVVVVIMVAAVYGKVDDLDKSVDEQLGGSLKYAAPTKTFAPTTTIKSDSKLPVKVSIGTKVNIKVVPSYGQFVVCEGYCQGSITGSVQDWNNPANALLQGTGSQTISLLKGTYEIRGKVLENCSDNEPYVMCTRNAIADVPQRIMLDIPSSSSSPQDIAVRFHKKNVLKVKMEMPEGFRGYYRYMDPSNRRRDVYINSSDMNPYIETYTIRTFGSYSVDILLSRDDEYIATPRGATVNFPSRIFDQAKTMEFIIEPR